MSQKQREQQQQSLLEGATRQLMVAKYDYDPRILSPMVNKNREIGKGI
jgi:hypothetical protein